MKGLKLASGILFLLSGILILFAMAASSHTGVFKENIAWIIAALFGILIGLYAIVTWNKR